MAPSVGHTCVKNFHVRKHVKLYIKTYVLIFYIFSFLPKYLCIVTYACENHHYANDHNLNYPIFHLNLFHVDLYLKDSKNKILESYVQKGVP